MQNIRNIENITRIYPHWQPNHVAFLKNVQWTTGSLTITACCQPRSHAHLWPDTSADFLEISLCFQDVLNLQLKIDTVGLQQITGFDIQDPSSEGLEGINFKIEDYEEGSISFYCKSIEAIGPPVQTTLD